MVSTSIQSRPKRKAAEAALEAIRKSKRLDDKYEQQDLKHRREMNSTTSFHRHGSVVHFGDKCTLPVEMVCLVFKFLPQPELVHTVGLVSSLWNHISKSPIVWKSLDFSHTVRASPRALTTMGSFSKLIRRPQFAFIKKVGFPNIHYHTLNRNIFTKLSKACPLLEHIDLSELHDEKRVGVRPFDEELVNFPIIFPKLNSIHLELLHCTNMALEQFVNSIGSRLLDLAVTAGRNFESGSFCFDATLKTIGLSCLNLESFSYGFHWDCQEDECPEFVTDEGIISLLRACPNLKYIKLTNLHNIGKEAFKCMVEHSNLTLSLTGHPVLDFGGRIVKMDELRDHLAAVADSDYEM